MNNASTKIDRRRHALLLAQNLLSRAGRLLEALHADDYYGLHMAGVMENYRRLHSSTSDLIGKVQRGGQQ